ncbi:succinylglutamate desuccinylase/aspartoacylase family protein [uncultured Ruegeria sp.]|uniref:succinylglutamate desuccinylase/aspartoacylase family protein n=1 Tax=uncultured Ruegeria sp. TaxID=259304 RepID=UPI00262FAB9B|nr:succinylglutamate desuccinylase/aspartoacylase family protein [uncultured Ruegeria sp.]
MSLTPSNQPSRLSATIDLDLPGKQVGDLMLKWSDNSVPLGYHPVPIVSLRGGAGPTVLMLGGTHGDEFEGPAAILRLAEHLDPAELHGQIILIPALNAPAVAESSRVSPLDGQNLNRAFPGDPDGGPTAMLAHYVETVLLSRCDAVIDLHSGGKASVFAPCALATHCADPDLAQTNLDLAHIFGLPLIWMLGKHNDNRSVNAAAERVGVPMIAAELGGGGNITPEIVDATETGLMRCLAHLGLVENRYPAPKPARCVEILSPFDSLYAPEGGIFDRQVSAGQDVQAGDVAGYLRFPDTPGRPAVELSFPNNGFVLAHGNRGLVRQGDLLALVAQNVTEGS